ncbi:MAG: hypothetical protein ACP5IE_00205 [Infirmifilum sp.]
MRVEEEYIVKRFKTSMEALKLATMALEKAGFSVSWSLGCVVAARPSGSAVVCRDKVEGDGVAVFTAYMILLASAGAVAMKSVASDVVLDVANIYARGKAPDGEVYFTPLSPRVFRLSAMSSSTASAVLAALARDGMIVEKPVISRRRPRVGEA